MQTQQHSLPEKLPGLSTNRPMARFDFHVQCNHLLARISAFFDVLVDVAVAVVVAFKAPCYLRFYGIGEEFVETSQQLTLKKTDSLFC